MDCTARRVPASVHRRRKPFLAVWLVVLRLTSVCVRCLSLISVPDNAHQQSRYHDHQKNKELLVLGLGRVGLEVANQASAMCCFGAIAGTVRSGSESLMFEQDDSVGVAGDCLIRRVPFHEMDAILHAARSCTHLLITVPPPAAPPAPNDNNLESKDETRLLDQVFDSVVEMLPNEDTWIGMISTTGVYGNHNGAWVTEDSPCLAVDTGTSARRYIDYENDWANRAQGNNQQRFCIFRCAGIYGPRQSALHTVFKNGAPALADKPLANSAAKGSGVVTNRIHVVDLAAAVVASMMKAPPSTASSESNSHMCSIYNVSDDLPASRTEVMGHAADLLRSVGATIPEPQKPTREVSRRARRRQTDQKRVCNKKIRRELLDGNPLKYPTYREGLAEILQDRTNPWWQL